MKTLTIQFDTPMRLGEVPYFRGAVLASLCGADVLFHNHGKSGLRYSYPLVQYKSIGGRAAIFCIGEGTKVIGGFFAKSQQDMYIGREWREFHIEEVKSDDADFAFTGTPQSYTITSWAPLNRENYWVWRNADGMSARLALLERILCGNILSMLKGIDIFTKERVTAVIDDIRNVREFSYKGVPLVAMDTDFHTNILLPGNIGLGRHASIGYGLVNRKEQTH
ncbi:MAG: CRISPR-associated endonuclease Cas6 [Succinivibrionaceae bacterium]|nr:CRISPR-associated endonuclease Cas6 [Succinivibrionaceae bacterium]